MSNTNIIKQYSINIDFLNYEKKRDVTKSIVYSKGDVNTAFIYATLSIGSKIINLNDSTVVVNVRNNEGECFTNICEIIDAKKGIISIPFTSSSLSKVGFSKFEVVVCSNDKQIVSPMFGYRVSEDISSEGAMEGTDEYSFLLVLISQVQEMVDNVKNIEDEISVNEEIRIDNENNRQQQEVNRENVFNDRVSIIDSKLGLIGEALVEANSKISEIDNVKNSLSDTVNDKIEEITETVNNKIIDIDEDISNKLYQVDKDVKSILDENFDSKATEIDLTITQKINEVNVTVNENIVKINSKISEINNVKNNLVSEINQTKNDLSSVIDNKVANFEDRFKELESSNPTGEIIQARTDLDGVVHDSLSKRLETDFNKKSNNKNIHVGEGTPEEGNIYVWIDTSFDEMFIKIK